MIILGGARLTQQLLTSIPQVPKSFQDRGQYQIKAMHSFPCNSEGAAGTSLALLVSGAVGTGVLALPYGARSPSLRLQHVSQHYGPLFVVGTATLGTVHRGNLILRNGVSTVLIHARLSVSSN